MEHKKKIGFIFGLKREMELISNKRNNVYCVYGYGKSSKKATLKLLDFGVDIIINFGFAGSVSKELKNGDIILANKIFNEKRKKFSNLECDKNLLRNLKNNFEFRKCNLLTVEKIVTDKREKKNIFKNFKSISAIDMEAFHIGEELLKEKIPMISLKVIFDDLSFDIPRYMKGCIDSKGNLKVRSFLVALISSPTRIFEILKLNHKFLKSKRILKNLVNSLSM